MKKVIESMYNFWKDEDEKTLFEVRYINNQKNGFREILGSFKTEHYKHVDYSAIWYIRGGI